MLLLLRFGENQVRLINPTDISPLAANKEKPEGIRVGFINSGLQSVEGQA